MTLSFKQYLANELFEGFFTQISEEDIVTILSALKKKVAQLLNEDIEIDNQKVNHYLKIVAIFEQFFRFVLSKKIDPKEIVGFSGLLKNKNIDTANENNVERSIEHILNGYDKHHFINFKRVVDRRASDFSKWFFGDNKEDLKIVHDAIDFTLKNVESLAV